MNNRWLTNGPFLKKFEKNFARILKSKFSIGVTNATSGLHLAVKSLGIKKGDEVIVPTLTFAATANSVIYCGAKPILADIDERTFNISPEEIKKKITKRTKAVIVVHYGGQSCEMEKISNICKNKGVKIIEDCAHSLGTTFKKMKCGTIGKIGVFSFYPTKIITTAEGGMIVTNDSQIAKKINKLRSHAIDIPSDKREKDAKWRYNIEELGFNYRLDELSAALGFSQLQRYNQANSKRQKIAKMYDDYLKKIDGITIPYRLKNSSHIFHLYTIKVGEEFPVSRDELFLKLAKKGIGASVQYTPLHKFPYMKNFSNFKNNDFPVANKIYDEIISLPLFPQMTKQQVNTVIKNIKN